MRDIILKLFQEKENDSLCDIFFVRQSVEWVYILLLP